MRSHAVGRDAADRRTGSASSSATRCATASSTSARSLLRRTVPITVAPLHAASCAAIEPDAAEHAVDEHRRAVDRAVAEHRAVGGDARDAEARTELVADLVRQRDGLLGGHDRELGGRAERAVGLGAVDPDAFADPGTRRHRRRRRR